MSDTTLNTFPANKFSALAMLYVEKHATSESTPEELLDMYTDAYDRIREHNKKDKRGQAIYV